MAAGLKWPIFPPFYEHLDLKLETLAGGKAVISLPYARHFGKKAAR
jgi:hypothetical protein